MVGVELFTFGEVPVSQLAGVFAASFGDLDQLDEWVQLIERELDSGRVSVAGSVAARVDNALSAACLVNHCASGRARIGPTGVLPSARRRGLGRRLVAEALRRLQADGATRVTLEVSPENTAACSLYASLGFEVGRGIRILRGRRSGLPAHTGHPVECISREEALAAMEALHPEEPAFQRRAPYIASFEEGVVSRGVRSAAGELIGILLQRGASVLDIVALDADPRVLCDLLWEATDLSWSLRLINVVEDDPGAVVLESLGFEVESRAMEMFRVFS